ncbi:hypothetical protein PIB30_049376 [Stylosanthes scabra]|uniref:Uncharacterized protein n=1 Tax=Stylosanthes scabra TaxID=79078 RepID=A0ABU6VGF6_9FABA|nr:hypothetical protein [Stylosanthes scabra]
MSDQRSFLALVHHTGKIKKNLRVGIRFSSKEPKLGVANSKRVSKLFYRALVAVVSEHVQYSPFVINSNDDLEVIFHCRRDFPEVRTTELYAKLVDIVASSDGSNQHPPSVHIGGSSSLPPPAEPAIPVIPAPGYAEGGVPPRENHTS